MVPCFITVQLRQITQIQIVRLQVLSHQYQVGGTFNFQVVFIISGESLREFSSITSINQ